jgi:hypothetical protein
MPLLSGATGKASASAALGLIGESRSWGPAVHQRLYDNDSLAGGDGLVPGVAKLLDEHADLEATTTDQATKLADAAMFTLHPPTGLVATEDGAMSLPGGGGVPADRGSPGEGE